MSYPRRWCPHGRHVPIGGNSLTAVTAVTAATHRPTTAPSRPPAPYARVSRVRVAAAEFAKFLNKVSDYKHKSWYVHHAVYVVPEQMYLYGDLRRFATHAIEARGGRFKRIARRCISWRPWSAKTWVYDYIDRRSNKRKQRFQGNSTSAATQLLTRMLRLEESWHARDSVFAKPEHARLQAQLRASRFKVQEGTVRPDVTNPSFIDHLMERMN